jgi:glycosyltransferase involved in cell wall biosynthesis
MRTCPRVSVVIPTYNRRESLRRTLRSLVKQEYDPSLLEVLVADTGSTDGTAEMVAEFGPPFSLRRLSVPKRYPLDAPIARNAGAEAATGEIIIFLDSDVVVPRHFIREHVFCHEYVNHAFVGGAVCHVFGMGKEDSVDGGRLNSHSPGMLAPYQAGMLEFSGNLGSCRFPWSYCYGANYSMTKEDSVSHALWADEAFAEKGLAASDTELSYRAYLTGLRIVFSRFAVAYHDLGTAPTFNSTERTDRVMKGLNYIISKHPSSESGDYVDFRLRDCEEFLNILQKGSQLRKFPVLGQEEWLKWMEKILGSSTPASSILLFTNGNADRVERVLVALGKLGGLRNDFEVLVLDASASGRLGASRRGQTVDILVQTLKTDFCLRYYPVADMDPGIGHVGTGLKSHYAHSEQFKQNLSRSGWYFSVLNTGLYGRVRGRVLILLDDTEEITAGLLATSESSFGAAE